MYKRSGENLDKNDSKKQKLNNDNIDALWEDDLDVQVLDDCIKLANEVCEEEGVTCTQRNNITILPTYNAFKDKAGTLFSSTQVETATSKVCVQTTSNKTIVELKTEIEKLRKDCELKGGEVAILRGQLKDNKVIKEWKEKLNVVQKDLKSTKSELEFKNLEIANLKQKLHDLKKLNLDTSLNSTQKFTSPKKLKTSVLQTSTSNVISTNLPNKVIVKPKFQPILHSVSPLSSIISTEVPEKHVLHIAEMECTKLCRNTIPYLQNRVLSSKSDIDFHKCKNKEIKFSNILPEIYILLKSNLYQLDSDVVTPNIEKVFKYLWGILEDLHDFLLKMSKNMKDEDIKRADANQSEMQSRKTNKQAHSEEIGLKASQILNILSEIILYNRHSFKCLYSNSITVDSNFGFWKENGHRNLLLKLLDIVIIIRKYRKAEATTDFLCSLSNLLTNMFKSKYFQYEAGMNPVIKLASEIILSRPKSKVIVAYTKFLKTASHNSEFVEFFYKMAKKGVHIDSKTGLLHFTEDTCTLYLFCLMFENSVIRTKQLTVDVGLNMLTFMFNTYKSNYWVYQRENVTCDCISYLHKLGVEIVYEALEQYLGNKKHHRVTKEWEVFLKHKITLEVLNLMGFNNYDHIEKYIIVFSQFKEVEQTLLDEKYINDLEKLSLSEEIVVIPASSFSNIDF